MDFGAARGALGYPYSSVGSWGNKNGHALRPHAPRGFACSARGSSTLRPSLPEIIHPFWNGKGGPIQGKGTSFPLVLPAFPPMIPRLLPSGFPFIK